MPCYRKIDIHVCHMRGTTKHEPHLSAGGRNCSVPFACRAAPVVAAKEGSATEQAVSLAGLSPQRPGFDSRSVSVRFMTRSTVTTSPSPSDEFSVGQLQTCINNCPTRCNTKSIYYSAYWSYFSCSYLPPTWPSLATLELGSCSTGGCS